MLQRIQSLYLFISLVLYLILFFTPIFNVHGNNEVYTVFSYKISPVQNVLNLNVWPICISVSMIFLIQLIALFSYKKRKLQIRLLQFNIILVLLSIITIGIYLYHFSGISEDAHIHLTLNVSIPFISAILFYMAIKGIRRDQALINSLDRLR